MSILSRLASNGLPFWLDFFLFFAAPTAGLFQRKNGANLYLPANSCFFVALGDSLARFAPDVRAPAPPENETLAPKCCATARVSCFFTL